MSTASKDFYKALGATVRRERRSRGISQETVADLLGVTFQQIQKYEGGLNRYPLEGLIKVADLFAIDVAVFFKDLKPASEMTAEDEVAAELFLISRYFRLLSAPQRKAQVYYLKMLTALQGQVAA